MKKTRSKLSLRKQTVTVLSQSEMSCLNGGDLVIINTVLRPEPVPWDILKPQPDPWVVLQTVQQITI